VKKFFFGVVIPILDTTDQLTKIYVGESRDNFTPRDCDYCCPKLKILLNGKS
jgi:hypothetical protein